MASNSGNQHLEDERSLFLSKLMEAMTLVPTETTRELTDAQKEEDEKRSKQLRKEEREAYRKSLVTSEREKLNNLNKLRIRNVPEFGWADPKLFAIRIFNNMLDADVNSSDIADCACAPPWIGIYLVDIVVTFTSEKVRNSVYNKRTEQNSGLYLICDELGKERTLIWKQLVQAYGEFSVFTHSGGVHLRKMDRRHRFLTLRELRLFFISVMFGLRNE